MDSDYEMSPEPRRRPRKRSRGGGRGRKRLTCICGFEGKNKASLGSHRGKCSAWQLNKSSNTRSRIRKIPTPLMIFKKEKQDLSRTTYAGMKQSDIMEHLSRDFKHNEHFRQEYGRIQSVISQEIDKLRWIELEMERYGAANPENCVVDDSTWQFSGNPAVFTVLPFGKTFVKSTRRFGASVEQQRELFLELYRDWKITHPSLQSLPPFTVGGDIINLFDLFRAVVKAGGFAKVLNKQQSWRLIGRELGLHGTPETLMYQLQLIYFKTLFLFEQRYQVVSEDQKHDPLPSPWQDYSAVSVRASMSEFTERPMKRRKITREYDENLASENSLRALMLSLRSRDPKEMNWALNRLQYLAYCSKDCDPLVLKKYPELVDTLVDLLPRMESEFQQFDTKYVEGILKEKLSGRKNPLSQSVMRDLMELRTSRNNDPKMVLVILRIFRNFCKTSQNLGIFTSKWHLMAILMRYLREPNWSLTYMEDEDMSAIRSECLGIFVNCSHRMRLDEIYADHSNWVKMLISTVEQIICLDYTVDETDIRSTFVLYGLKILINLAANAHHGPIILENIREQTLSQLIALIRAPDGEIQLFALTAMGYICEVSVLYTHRFLSQSRLLRDLIHVSEDAKAPAPAQTASFIIAMMYNQVRDTPDLLKQFEDLKAVIHNAAAKSLVTPEYLLLIK